MQPRTSRGWKFSVILTTCLILALVCVAYPIYVIRPFRAQGARELAVALVVSRFRPVFSAVLALVAIWAAVGYWRENARIWRRIVMIVGAVFACVLAVLARVNVYELMFHPIERVEFVAGADLKLDKDDKLIAVKIGKTARAYPIRTMGYHHIANDLVGGTAIVATY